MSETYKQFRPLEDVFLLAEHRLANDFMLATTPHPQESHTHWLAQRLERNEHIINNSATVFDTGLFHFHDSL
jgi:hypothetical protein